jgi:hypothetical protein
MKDWELHLALQDPEHEIHGQIEAQLAAEDAPRETAAALRDDERPDEHLEGGRP